ncbi:hypothetical protein ACFL54_01015 [Planctomycetota bacterium]
MHLIIQEFNALDGGATWQAVEGLPDAAFTTIAKVGDASYQVFEGTFGKGMVIFDSAKNS